MQNPSVVLTSLRAATMVSGADPYGLIDEAALVHAKVFVNGGQRGLQVRLDPADLVSALGAKVAGLT